MLCATAPFQVECLLHVPHPSNKHCISKQDPPLPNHMNKFAEAKVTLLCVEQDPDDCV